MRGIVAKRLRHEARQIAANQPTKAGIIERIKNRTLKYTGYRRVYKDLKRAISCRMKRWQRGS